MKAGVIHETVPLDHWQFVLRRVTPLLQHWGHHVTLYTLEQLAASCYQQGLLDALQLSPRPTETQPPDFQI